MSVALVSDHTHYLPPALVQRIGLHDVPLYLHWHDQAVPESQLNDNASFFRELAHAEQLPTTSQPSIGDFLATYEPLIAEGHDIVSIHLAGGISGTVRAAEQARDQLGEARERVHVIDSHSCAGGMGLMLLAAHTAAAGGADAPAAATRAQAVRDRLHLRFSVDTLEYLRRGGRIGDARAWLGSALQLKPILAVDYVITPVDRVRTAKRALAHMISVLEGAHADGADAWFIQHIAAPDQAAELVAAGRKIFGTEPRLVSEVGPVIGTHVGPGVLAVGAAPADLVGPTPAELSV